MKKLIKKILIRTPSGLALLNWMKRKWYVFHPASIEAFSYLDRFWKKKTIETVYQKAFDDLFILLKAFRLKGDIFEFGVYQGFSSRLFARYLKKFEMDQSSLHLFDSFEGLPEESEIDGNSYECAAKIWEKGSMRAVHGMDQYLWKKLSKIIGPNRVHISKGYFENTMEKYFAGLGKKAMIIHLDCDLYSSSKYVLDFVLKHEVVQDGTIVIFDDWMTSLGNPNLGQRKAASEVLGKYPFWFFEPYLSYGVGSQVFIAHDLRIKNAADVNLSTIAYQKN